MIVCIHCNTETKSKNKLLGRGAYRDYSELMAMAVDNLRLPDLVGNQFGTFGA